MEINVAEVENQTKKKTKATHSYSTQTLLVTVAGRTSLLKPH